MSPLREYTEALDRTATRVPSGAARWPRDKRAAAAVLTLAAGWLERGHLPPELIAACEAYMTAAEAVQLAQTLAGLAQRGVSVARPVETSVAAPR